MAYLRNKFDIGPLRRKNSLDARQTPNYNFYFSQVEPRKKSQKKPKVFRIGPILSFAILAMISMSLVYSLTYLSRARSVAGQILGDATSAYQDLSLASGSLQNQDFDQASSFFKSAQDSLLLAQQEFDQYRFAGLVASQARSAGNVLDGAYLLSEAGRNLSTALGLFDDLKVDSGGIQTAGFTVKLQENHRLLSNALSLTIQAEEKLKSSSGLPNDYQQIVARAQQDIQRLSGVLRNLVELEDLYLSFFGSQEKTYLLVFQNPDEMRATGGFIGTYGILKIDNGGIKSLKIDSIYDLDGRITKRIASPGPFQPVIIQWGIRDANWFADFSLSATKLLYFLEQSQETADGVIAVTPKLFEDLLGLVGPIYMDQYGIVLTQSNFQKLVQYKTSVDYDREENEPKKFLADFAPILLNRLSDLKKEDWFRLFQILRNNLAEKYILLYSKNTQTQEKISQLNFSGEISPASGDYLAVINSNMGGTKTDLQTGQKVDLTTKILNDGTVINYLRLNRFNASPQFNRNFLRVLVPMGSQLISIDGVESGLHLASSSEGLIQDPHLAAWDQGELMWDRVFVRSESGKTEFSAWMTTQAQTASEVLFVYRLPFKIKPGIINPTRSYEILIQKQAGSLPYEFHQHLDAQSQTPVWTTANTVVSQGIDFTSTTQKDDYWAVILKNE